MSCSIVPILFLPHVAVPTLSSYIYSQAWTVSGSVRPSMESLIYVCLLCYPPPCVRFLAYIVECEGLLKQLNLLHWVKRLKVKRSLYLKLW
jgi:hypothetical protein